MYARIWNRFLYDNGISPVKEPFKKLVHQGMILGENGIKMGKRFPEFVVNPSDIVREYGADTLRLYEMFMGPLEVSKPWSSSGVAGARKFINRVWNFFTEPTNITDTNDGSLERLYHQTVKKVTTDFETLGFNTAIAQMMVFVNEVYKNGSCPREYAEGFIKMLSCITPHVGEEMWQILGHNKSIAHESWPAYDEAKCASDVIEMPVQVNGKVRSLIIVSKTASKDDVLNIVMNDDKVKAAIDGKTIVKEIVVPGKIINIVVR
jgi:leucyl-tRNA synthetase